MASAFKDSSLPLGTDSRTSSSSTEEKDIVDDFISSTHNEDERPVSLSNEGHIIPPPIETFKDQKKELDKLEKENFRLKLSIYHLEQSLRTRNSQGQANNEEIEMQMAHKDQLLMKAKSTIDQYGDQQLALQRELKENSLNYENKLQDLQEQVWLLDHNLTEKEVMLKQANACAREALDKLAQEEASKNKQSKLEGEEKRSDSRVESAMGDLLQILKPAPTNHLIGTAKNETSSAGEGSSDEEDKVKNGLKEMKEQKEPELKVCELETQLYQLKDHLHSNDQFQNRHTPLWIISKYELQNPTAETKIEKLQAKIDELSQQLEELQGLLKAKDEELAKILSHNTYLENQMEQLLNTNLKLTEETMTLRLEITNQANGMEKAEREIEESSRALDILKEEQSRASEQYKGKIQVVKKEKEEVEARASLLEQEKDRLEEELTLIRAKYKSLDLRMTDLHQKLKLLADKKEDISTKLEITEEQLLSKDKAYRDMEAMYRKLNNQYEASKQKLTDARMGRSLGVHSDAATMGTSHPSKSDKVSSTICGYLPEDLLRKILCQLQEVNFKINRQDDFSRAKKVQKKLKNSLHSAEQETSESESWNKSWPTSYSSQSKDWSKKSSVVSTETQLKNLKQELEKTLNIRTLTAGDRAFIEALLYNLRPWRKHDKAAPNPLTADTPDVIKLGRPSYQESSTSSSKPDKSLHAATKTRKQEDKRPSTSAQPTLSPVGVSANQDADGKIAGTTAGDGQWVCKTHINLGPLLQELLQNGVPVAPVIADSHKQSTKSTTYTATHKHSRKDTK